MEQNVQLSAVLLGTSLQFSNQLIRVLAFEFSEVQFDRHHDAAALSSVARQPDLVVIHESLPDLKTSVQDARTRLPQTMIAIACTDIAVLQRNVGADTLRSVGLLPINAPIDVWLSILRLLLCGHAYVPAEVYREVPESAARRTEAPARVETAAKVCLTPREMQILPLIAKGLQNKVIAGSLDLSEHTVKLHTHNIFSKLGVSNRTAAATWYLSQIETDEVSEQTHGQ